MAEDLSNHFYFEHREDYEPLALKKYFVDKSSKVDVVENGIVLPARQTQIEGRQTWEGGVCDKDFNFVAGFSSDSPSVIKRAGARDVLHSYVVDKEEITYLDEDVIFGGVLMGHFGHFILESWSRLWYVIHPTPPTHTLYTIHHNDKIKVLFGLGKWGYQSWFDKFFELMGISKERIIYVKQPIQCRSVIVPEQSMYGRPGFTKEYLIPYDAIKANVTPGNVKKLYLSRKDFEINRKKCYNEQYFEDFFVAHGFKSVEMEKLGIEEQISLVMGADEIAAGTGTLTHFAFFCKPTAKFIMLSRLNKYYGWQALVNEATKINAYVVDCDGSFLLSGWNNFFTATKSWNNFVADYFHEYIISGADSDTQYFDEELKNYIARWFDMNADKKDLCINSVKNLYYRIRTLEKIVDKNRPLIIYQTHVGKKGWSDWIVEKQLSNSLEQNFDIQAVKIDFSSQFCDVYYSVYYGEKEGWSKEITNPKVAGTVGKYKPIFGIKVRLDDTGREKYDIWYRFHTFEGKWTSWAKNGEELISPNVKLNSLQIKLENKQKLLFKQIEPGTFTVNN